MAARPLALVVEDDPRISGMLRDLLELEDWSVVIASTVASARQALHQLAQPVRLVVLDQKLPDGRGLSLISEARSTFPEARIVVLTASTGLTRDLEGKLVDALFHKPMELKRFLEELKAARPAG